MWLSPDFVKFDRYHIVLAYGFVWLCMDPFRLSYAAFGLSKFWFGMARVGCMVFRREWKCCVKLLFSWLVIWVILICR